MPRPPAPRPDDPPEWVAAAVRFSFGAVFGLVLGAGSFFLLPSDLWYVTVAVVVACALVCGFLAAKYGDGFWENVKTWWW